MLADFTFHLSYGFTCLGRLCVLFGSDQTLCSLYIYAWDCFPSSLMYFSFFNLHVEISGFKVVAM